MLTDRQNSKNEASSVALGAAAPKLCWNNNLSANDLLRSSTRKPYVCKGYQPGYVSIHSFFYSENVYSALSRNLLRRSQSNHGEKDQF